ncbi:MAG: glycerol-3-phosphate cytidylyltransferase [Lachnospiraceae bacterium]|nr:glycerol-3-phosphate cytidylyltransferase [Lachnospiraceae bacterium]
MKKVITYGTYDLLHYGHVKLLERAKALGDYLIVGITSDAYDMTRGKINNQQSLMERIAAVEALGIADQIIVEEYEGQKIDDIKRFAVDIFTVGSDWKGQFDYLNDICQVVYLDRTEGVSSSEIRTEKRKIKIKVEGSAAIGNKFINESKYVNGVQIVDTNDETAMYLVSSPQKHYSQIKEALCEGKHVLCESPLALNRAECDELFSIANENNCILMEGIKTAYSTAYARLVLLAKSGKIGSILSIDATCTSMKYTGNESENQWNSISAWGPTALLPIFQILGTDYLHKSICTRMVDSSTMYDGFTKIDFVYPNAVASIKVAKEAKSEGDLIITGTEGYIYVPAPWWKTDYFEVRYENMSENKRYFYQLDGEGIRYEIIAFARAIENGKADFYIDTNVSKAICGVVEDYYNNVDVYHI